MSTPVLYLVDDAAQAIGDPNKERVSLAQWLSIYNRSNRELGEKANLFRFLDQFDLVALQAKYAYPEGMTVMNGIHVTETPDDESTFQWIREYFEDEFRAMTTGGYGTATLPTGYFATSAWYYLLPTATDLITNGACIDYFGLPDRVSDLAGAVMQAPDFAQDYLLRRMIIYGMQARNRLVEAKAELELWIADVEGLNDKLEDRSQDRRSSIAPRRNRFSGMR